jgi:hypothetical protein
MGMMGNQVIVNQNQINNRQFNKPMNGNLILSDDDDMNSGGGPNPGAGLRMGPGVG